MKLSTVVLASTAIVLGIAACAAPEAEEHEELGQTSQALCPRGQICTPPKNTWSNWWGGTSSGLVAVDFGTTSSTSSSGGATTVQCGLESGEEFTCGGPVVTCDGTIAKTTGEACDLVLRCDPQNPTVCDCGPGCGGGGFGFGSFNPCMAGLTYTCTSWGACRCN